MTPKIRTRRWMRHDSQPPTVGVSQLMARIGLRVGLAPETARKRFVSEKPTENIREFLIIAYEEADALGMTEWLDAYLHAIRIRRSPESRLSAPWGPQLVLQFAEADIVEDEARRQYILRPETEPDYITALRAQEMATQVLLDAAYRAQREAQCR